MSKTSVISVGFLFLALWSFAQAESPSSVDQSRLPHQVERIDGVLVPIPSEIFNTQDKFPTPNWQIVLRPELAALRPSGNAAHIALSLGIVVGEGFIAVAAENRADVQKLGKAALKLARALGVEKSVLRRVNSIVDHADNKEWAAVRKEWSGVNVDLKRAMIELQSEPLSQLVSLGGWLRGADALSNLVSQHYSAENAQLLHQPVLLDYFGKRLSQMGSRIRVDPTVIDMENGIMRLRPLIVTGNSRPISEKDVKEIHDMVAGLIKSIDTRAQ